MYILLHNLRYVFVTWFCVQKHDFKSVSLTGTRVSVLKSCVEIDSKGTGAGKLSPQSEQPSGGLWEQGQALALGQVAFSDFAAESRFPRETQRFTTSCQPLAETWRPGPSRHEPINGPSASSAPVGPARAVVLSGRRSPRSVTGGKARTVTGGAGGLSHREYLTAGRDTMSAGGCSLTIALTTLHKEAVRCDAERAEACVCARAKARRDMDAATAHRVPSRNHLNLSEVTGTRAAQQIS